MYEKECSKNGYSIVRDHSSARKFRAKNAETIKLPG